MLIEADTVIAWGTIWPAGGGRSAAPIEEEVPIAPTGHVVLTRFPAETLLFAGAAYQAATGPPDSTRVLKPTPGGTGRPPGQNTEDRHLAQGTD